ncbi:Gfo/Idh/MocA family protein [Rubrobacter aplysinae]|uniref:Gfo/Idh/MocA family protein n=1 Tax=Rubrobacter aplysinae TaxID=909625 RepID=UPI00064C2FD0|nr:Gfo/Idh/MocA family oxidoreductase [Rubrobacter aplysinae]
MKHRAGIVGLGSIASKMYLPLLCNHPGVEVAGLVSRSPETVQSYGEQYGVSHRSTDLRQLLVLEPEIVFVSSPTETHFEIVTQCLRAGVNVYVDKPLSYDLAEAEEMAALAEARGLLLAVGFNRRFVPLYREARDWMEAGGGLELAVAHKSRTASQRAPARQTVYDDLIHVVDTLVWLGGPAAETLHYAQRLDDAGRLLTATGTLSLGEAAAQFWMQRSSGGNGESLELHGGGRYARVTGLERGVLGKEGTELTRVPGGWDPVAHRRGFTGMIDHVLQSLAEPTACEVGAEKVLPTHRICEQLLLRH